MVLALIGTLAIVTYVRGADDRAQAGEKIVKVLTVKTTVPAGTSAKDLGASVALESISRKVMADGAVTSVKSLGKKVAGTTLVAGEQVIARVGPAVSHQAAQVGQKLADGSLPARQQRSVGRRLQRRQDGQ